MDINIQKAIIQDKSILRNLLELCHHDYSEFNPKDVNEHGLFGYKYLDHYWIESGRYPFLVRVSGKLAGFVLVRDIDFFDNKVTHTVAEFFILRKFRRQGTGQKVAHRIFDMFPGRWRVEQEDVNLPAQAFWRKVIFRYTKGQFKEMEDKNWKGPIQEFNT